MFGRQDLASLAAALPGARLDRAVPIGQGWGTAAYRVPDPAGDWVVRLPLPRADWAVPGLEREARLLPQLEGWFETETPEGARPIRADDGSLVAVVHRYLPGRALRASAVPRRRRRQLASQIGGFLSRLHSLPVERARSAGVPDLDLWEDHYVELIERAQRHLGPAGRRWLSGQAEAFAASGGTRAVTRTLIHGDISGDHLLLDGDSQLAGVIDFGDAMVADPALDLAGILNGMGGRFLEHVLASYERPLDRDVPRRIRFYIEVEPIYQVVYGDRVSEGREQAVGIRRIAARAAAASRAARARP